MPGKKIELTTDLLIGQSAEMSSLSSEYKELFANISYTLKDANNNWCPNLSKNFSGKITSANRSFSDIVSMLNAGAAAARNSANTMDNLDQNLAKGMNGDISDDIVTIIPPPISVGTTSSSIISSIMEFLGNEWEEFKKGWKDTQALVEWYESLPKEVRQGLESFINSVDSTGLMIDTINIFKDVIKANSALEVADVLVEDIGNWVGKLIQGRATSGPYWLLGLGIRGQSKAWKPSNLIRDFKTRTEFIQTNLINTAKDIKSGDYNMLAFDAYQLSTFVVGELLDPANAVQATIYNAGYLSSDINREFKKGDSLVDIAVNVEKLNESRLTDDYVSSVLSEASGVSTYQTIDIAKDITGSIVTSLDNFKDGCDNFDFKRWEVEQFYKGREAYKKMSERKK